MEWSLFTYKVILQIVTVQAAVARHGTNGQAVFASEHREHILHARKHHSWGAIMLQNSLHLGLFEMQKSPDASRLLCALSLLPAPVNP